MMFCTCRAIQGLEGDVIAPERVLSGRVNPQIPKRFQRPFDEQLRSNLSGTVGIGKSTGRRHPPHLQQIGGSQETVIAPQQGEWQGQQWWEEC